MRLERVRSTLHRVRASQLGELRHLQAFVATRIDPAERFQVEIHVHRKTVIAGVTSDTDPDASKLLVSDIDAGSTPPRLGRDTELTCKPDHALRKRSNDIADT